MNRRRFFSLAAGAAAATALAPLAKLLPAPEAIEEEGLHTQYFKLSAAANAQRVARLAQLQVLTLNDVRVLEICAIFQVPPHMVFGTRE